MRRFRAAAGSVFFLAVAPGVVGGLIPWLLTGGRQPSSELAPGRRVIMLAAGSWCWLSALGGFVFEGIGTPAPVAPAEPANLP